MEVDVNVWAVLAGAVSTMLVGSIWYAKSVFGTSWQKLVGLNDKKMTEGSAKALSITFLLSLVTAYILIHIMEMSEAYFNVSQLQSGITTAFYVWLGFVLTRMWTHDLFEQRPNKLTLMNIANEFVTLMVMGAVVGWLN